MFSTQVNDNIAIVQTKQYRRIQLIQQKKEKFHQT